MYIQHPIKKGALSQYLKKPLGDDKKRSQEKKEEGEPKKKKEGPRTSNRILNTITTIMGFRARKREAREIASIGYDPYKQSQKSRWYRSEVPAWWPLDHHSKNWDHGHQRVLCDKGSNIDVLCASAFRGMRLRESKLVLVGAATYGVGPKELPVLACMELPTTSSVQDQTTSHASQHSWWNGSLWMYLRPIMPLLEDQPKLHSHEDRHQVSDCPLWDWERRCLHLRG